MGVAGKCRRWVSGNIVGGGVREARLRGAPPLTQDQLGGRLAGEGVQLDRVALGKVEGGLRSAFDFEVKALAAVLKVDANWLLGIDANSPPSWNRARQRGRGRA